MTYRLSFCELRSLWRGPRFQSPRIGRCLAFAVLMMALAGFVALATSPVVTQLQPRQATNELVATQHKVKLGRAMRDARFGIRDARFGIRDARFGIRDTGS